MKVGKDMNLIFLFPNFNGFKNNISLTLKIWAFKYLCENHHFL